MYKRIYDKDKFNSETAQKIRRQLALMNRYHPNKRGSKGMENQPFYTRFLNR